MKKACLLIAFLTMGVVHAQVPEMKPIPQINVSGEGKISVTPDQALISVSVETKGTQAADVKKQNDQTVEKVLQAIKKYKLPKEDVITKRVSLNPQFDYQKKKYNYNATQTIQILLKDLSVYDALMESLVDAGINRISGVEFKSSKIEEHKAEARKKAMRDAKKKAEDYVSVLNQKVGPAINIADNSQIYFPQPVMYEMKMASTADAAMPRETLAVGEIEITANVNVSFRLE